MEGARREMETNYFGTLSMCRAFAPVLGASGGGAVVNMLSVTSFYTNPFNGSYGASKAAEWSLKTVARQAFDAVEAGQAEVLVGERTRSIKASLSRDQELIYPSVQKLWDSALKGAS
jgi:NAD(P)-dependent dehydrogenase (short-subunit alcohol dehydrogenase family)